MIQSNQRLSEGPSSSELTIFVVLALQTEQSDSFKCCVIVAHLIKLQETQRKLILFGEDEGDAPGTIWLLDLNFMSLVAFYL